MDPRVDQIIRDHFLRAQAGVLRAHSLDSIADWICENTYVRGEKFSFVDHEFQETILRDPSREKVIRKCSQIGLSEIAAREALAIVNVLSASTLIYTLPTADFAKKFAKTRVDPVVRTSQPLRDAVSSTADNTDFKQFGDSFLYIKGTVGTGAAISVPADAIVNDEVDFSDQEVMSNYQSRLTHSPYKLKRKLSTPTVSGLGISAEFETSRRHWNFVKCSHCNHFFLPSYFEHVKFPGFEGEMREITRERLPTLRWQEARLLCPACGREPDMGPRHRHWVCENPGQNFEAAGYQVQPFDVPRIVTMPSLIEASTTYARYTDFVNFGLGLPAEDKESTLTKEDIDRCYVRGEAPGFVTHVMGVDLGLTCHIIVAAIDYLGRMVGVKTEIVPLPKLYDRRREIASQYRVALTVSDSQPYTDLLLRMQATDPNLYGAVYVNQKALAPYTIVKTEEADRAGEDDKRADAGELRERQVNVNRNKALDALMEFIRGGNLTIIEDENRPIFTAHLQDMKRVKDFTAEREISYVWRKSAKGNDHFHHALLYAWVAGKMRGIASSLILLPSYVQKFKVKTPV